MSGRERRGINARSVIIELQKLDICLFIIRRNMRRINDEVLFSCIIFVMNKEKFESEVCFCFCWTRSKNFSLLLRGRGGGGTTVIFLETFY